MRTVRTLPFRCPCVISGPQKKLFWRLAVHDFPSTVARGRCWARMGWHSCLLWWQIDADQADQADPVCKQQAASLPLPSQVGRFNDRPGYRLEKEGVWENKGELLFRAAVWRWVVWIEGGEGKMNFLLLRICRSEADESCMACWEVDGGGFGGWEESEVH